MNLKAVLGIAVGVLALSLPGYAHHSSANYDHENKSLVEVTVKQFKWTNPHSWIFMSVPDGKGGTEDWALECGSIAQLMQIGWTRNKVKPGDKIKVVAAIAHDGSNRGEIETLITADGKELKNRVGY